MEAVKYCPKCKERIMIFGPENKVHFTCGTRLELLPEPTNNVLGPVNAKLIEAMQSKGRLD